MIRFIFSTGSLYTYGIERCFELAGRAGFDGIELMADQRWDTRQPAYLLSLVERYGLPVVAVHAPLEIAKVPGWPDNAAERIEATVKLAEAVGAGVVVHHLPLRMRILWISAGSRRLPLPLPGQDDYTRWLQNQCQRLQDGTRVTLCIENLPAFRLLGRRLNPARWNTPAEMSRFSAITLDTTHAGTWGLDPAEFYDRLNGRVRHIHLSNFDGAEHRRPEDGQLHLDRMLARLPGDGYDGAVSLELSPDALSAGSPDDHIVSLMSASLRFCRAASAAGP